MSANAGLLNEDELSSLLVPVLIGGDMLTYSYVREFKRVYGIKRCIVIMTNDIKMLSSSRFTECIVFPDANDPNALLPKLDEVARRLKSEDPRIVPLILGSDDKHANIFAEHRDRLESAGFVVPYEDFEKISHLSDKHVFYDLCDQLDISYPKTWYFDSGPDGPEKLPIEELPMPIIVKASDSSRFKNATVKDKRKAYEIYSTEELEEVWSNLKDSDYDGEVIMQDFIPGDDDSLYIVNIFGDSEGKPKVVASGHLMIQDHCPSALGNPDTIINNDVSLIVEQGKKFIEHVKFHGWAVFDIKFDHRSGEYDFFEINIRPGRSSYYISLGGRSFIEPIVNEFVLGKPLEYIEGKDPFVYNLLPTYVLKRTIKDEDELAQVLRTQRITKLDPDPLHNDEDTFMHNFWAWCMKMNQIRKFKRYLWDTNGRQYREN